jgi:hypothetical protein
MPWAYEIDKDSRRVRTRGWGVVTFDELMAHQSHLREDHYFDPSFDQLIDLTRVQNITIDPEQVRALAAVTVYSPQSRRAIVSNNQVFYGLPHLFRAYRELSPNAEQIRIFESMDAACEWLDSPRPT